MALEQRSRPRVVVVGAGFGGLFTTRALAAAPVDIVLIDKNNYHTFIPLLYQVAAAELEPQEIAYPVRTFARRQRNARFMMAEVTDIDVDKQTVTTTTGEIDYDYAVLAAGSVTNFFGMNDVERHAFGIKDVHEAVSLRNHILERFEIASHTTDPVEQQALLTFVIVGGGPTGVEFSATLSELICGVLIKDFPELSFDDVRICLLEATDKLLPMMPSSMGAYTQRVLERKGIEVMLGAKVVGADATSVTLEGAEPIGAHTLVWTAGVKASRLAGASKLTAGRGGRVVVNEFMQAADYPNVYVIGDMAYTEAQGRPVPQVAPAAIQQAEVAAANIVRELKGEPLQPFHYSDKGTMVTIGRSKGVAATGRWKMKGFLAWLAWLAVHIVRLIGFRNRLYVLSSWAWSYVFQDRFRLIIKPPASNSVDPPETPPETAPEATPKATSSDQERG